MTRSDGSTPGADDRPRPQPASALTLALASPRQRSKLPPMLACWSWLRSLAALLVLIAPAWAGGGAGDPAAPLIHPEVIASAKLTAPNQKTASGFFLFSCSSASTPAVWEWRSASGFSVRGLGIRIGPQGPVNRWDPTGLDWEYVDGHWHYIDGTNPNVPRPNDGLTPARLGLTGNVFTASDYRRVVGFGSEHVAYGEFSFERVYGPLRKIAFSALYQRFGGPTLRGRDKANAIAAAMLLADLLDKNFDYENGDQRFFDPSSYSRDDVMAVLKQNYIRDTVFSGLEDTASLAAYGLGNVAAGSVRGVLASQFARLEAAAVATAGMRATVGIAEAEALAAARIAASGIPARTAIPSYWNGLPMARNLLQGVNELEIRLAGASVDKRVLLNPNLPQGRYMWVVDREGQFWVGSAQKHSGLVSAGEQVRGAGWLEVLPNGKIRINAGSGHYMDGYFYQLTPQEVAQWRNAVAATARAQGVEVEAITEADQFVDMVAPPVAP